MSDLIKTEILLFPLTIVTYNGGCCGACPQWGGEPYYDDKKGEDFVRSICTVTGEPIREYDKEKKCFPRNEICLNAKGDPQ